MKISLQIYSIREFGDFDTQLALAKSCGFDWVETVATHGLNASHFSKAIDNHGLKVSSMHASLELLESGGLPQLADACKLTGCPLIIMPWLPMGLRSGNAAGWKNMSERLSRIGDRVNALGLRLAYHNHDWEFLRYDGRTALEWIFSAASPEQLGWEADLGWVHRAGENAAHWVDLFANRLVAVHVKDIAEPGTAVAEDGWTTLGNGIVPWTDLLNRLKPQVNLFVFEHDHPVQFEPTLRQSHAFMSQHLS